MSDSKCEQCGRVFGWLSNRTRYRCEAEGCPKTALCSACSDYPLLPPAPATEIASMCKQCFCRLASIDRSRPFDVCGPEGAPAIVFVHGGGACRAMFAVHVRELSRQYRCYSLDLPGHGAQMDVPLTLDSATEFVAKFVTENIAPLKPLYVGASFGGYLGFHVLGKYPDLFAGAVIADAGQNVGPGRSIAASLGMMLLSLASSSMRKKTLVGQLLKQAPHVRKELLEEMIRAGYYFNQAQAQIDVLSAVSPAEEITKFDRPVLMINGENDHRDSEKRWLAQCKNEASRLIVYPEVDHMFTHDERSVHKFIKDIEDFAATVIAVAPSVGAQATVV